jgi:hypothetical protein
VNLSALKIHFMNAHNKFDVYRRYIQWAEEKANARLETYLDAFKRENVIPRDGDINEISWELDYVILNVTDSIPVEVQNLLSHEKTRIIKSAQRDLKIFIQEMKLAEKDGASKIKDSNAAGIAFHNTFNAPVTNFQQGPRNIQHNVTVNAEFATKINELLALVENSNLTQVQKLKVANDIKTVQELAKLEATPEVIEEAGSRLTGVQSVISLSADLVSLGMPIIQMIRAFFGL